MISDIGRSVVQRVTFQSATRYRTGGTPAAARASFFEGDLTSTGLHDTVASMEIQPGEVIAVWELPPGDDRPMREISRTLPPQPSRLLVRGATGNLLELNPAYVDINNRPYGYVEFTEEERARFTT